MKPKHGGMFSGLFDQLLSAMNEEEDEEPEVVGGASTSAAGTSGATGSRASPKKALATEDLD